MGQSQSDILIKFIIHYMKKVFFYDRKIKFNTGVLAGSQIQLVDLSSLSLSHL